MAGGCCLPATMAGPEVGLQNDRHASMDMAQTFGFRKASQACDKTERTQNTMFGFLNEEKDDGSECAILKQLLAGECSEAALEHLEIS